MFLVTSSDRDELAGALRNAGLRVTAPRFAVLSEVTEGKHMTADQVALAARERIGTISTQAVYDVLGALTRARPRAAGSSRPEALPATRRASATTITTWCAASCGAITDVDCVDR